VQACRIEIEAGKAVEGEMVGFDPAALSLRFRTNAQSPTSVLPFTRFRRLLMTVPLRRCPRCLAHRPNACRPQPRNASTAFVRATAAS
jgi:hypothetical protein